MTERPLHPEHAPTRAEQASTAGMLLAIDSVREGADHVLRVAGELDLAHAADLERELVRVEATDARRIVVDLSRMTFVDSTGVRVLLQAEARSRADSNRLTLTRAPATVHRVFVLCGVDGLLPFAD